MNQKPSVVAIRASLLYGVFACLWSVFSDEILDRFISDRNLLMATDALKDCIFVIFTAGIMFFVWRRMLGNLQDKLQKLKEAESLATLQKDALEMIAKSRPLLETLATLVRGVEAQLPGSAASILLLDAGGKHLRHGAAPSLPADYIKAIDGIAIGPKVGSCGTAAFRGSPVFVSDIEHDPLWRDCKHLALPHGLRACWSTPIFDDQKKVLGVFAVYERQTGLPADKQVQFVEIITHTAAEAIVKARMEEELRQSEASYRSFFNLVGEAVYVLDPEGKFLTVNAGAVEMYGYPTEFFIGKTPAALAAPGRNDLPATLEKINLAFAGQPQQLEWWGLRKNGEIFPKEVRLEKGIYFGQTVVFATGLDLTTRRAAEADLRHERQLLRTLIDLMPDFIFVKDLESRYLVANQSLAAGYCQTPARMLNHTDADFLPPDLAARFRTTELKVLADSASSMWEDTIEFPDGRTRTVVTTMSAFRNEQDEVCGLVGIGRDMTEAKRIQRSLQETQAQIQYILDNAQDVIFKVDLAGNYIFCNAAAERMTGYSTAQLLQMNMWQLVMPEYHGLIRDRLQKRVTGEPIENAFAFEIQHRDGRRLWTELTTSNVRDATGRLVAIQGVARDVTERKQAEVELAKLAAIVESSTDAIIGKTLDGIITSWNRGAENIFGYTAAETIGQPLLMLMPPERRDEEKEILAQTSLGQPVEHFETVRIRKDGRRIDVFVTISPVRNAAGKIVGAAKIARDITGQKQAAAAIVREQNRFKMVFDTIPIGIAFNTVYPDGSVSRIINDAHLRICGLTRDQYNNRDIYNGITHEDDRPIQKQWVEKINAGHIKSFSMEKRYLHADGRTVWVNFSYQREIYPDGTLQELTTVADITERKHLEEQLRQSQKMEAIGRLAGGVAHDFNNILTVILGNASLLLEPSERPIDNREFLRQIVQAAERAANLTRQLLLFSRKQIMRPVCLDLNRSLTATTEMFRRILGENFTLEIHCDPKLAPIKADAGMIDQVLLNLVVNARDAMPEGGRLTIATTMETINASQLEISPDAVAGIYVCLSVADTGIGMNPEILPRIFDPFFTTKEVGKGTGLGLATVYGIVKQHNGWITVESKPNQGSIFRIYFPVLPGSTLEIKPEPDTEQLAEGRGTILVVEDELPLRNFVTLLLKRIGYHVLEADTGVNALKLWHEKSEEIDLVLTDIIMPNGMSGLEMAQQMRQHKPALKIIFTSGYSQESPTNQPGLIVGVNFLPKPYQPQELARILHAALE